MTSNENAMDFARSLAHNINPFMSDCYAFGMAYGCRTDCPVFIKGECDTVRDDPEAMAKMVTDEYGTEGEEVKELIALYPQFERILNA